MAESKASSSETEPDREATPPQPPSSQPEITEEAEANDGDETQTEAGTENGASQATEANSQSPAPVRRSGRTRAAPLKLQDSLAISEAVAAAAAAAAASTDGARRNPKRKASEPARQLGFPPSELLNEALRPLEPADIEEWEGWIELESEPVSRP